MANDDCPMTHALNIPDTSALRESGIKPPRHAQDMLRSSGQPLDSVSRAFMEPRFGRSFSDVRVHSDAMAADSAEAVNARAYTVGNHVAFGPGQYAPHSPAGQRLLAHELAHVVQQGGRQFGGPLQVAPTNDSAEGEADRAADQVLSDRRAYVVQPSAHGGHALQRQPKETPKPGTRSDRSEGDRSQAPR